MQTFDARAYLKIDIANSWGLDKKDWDERIQWFDENEHQLLELVKTADTPALYFAGLMAWRDVQEGTPTGYPISLDGCASGIQLMACLTGDREAAKLCGVIDTGHREDAYTVIYEHMISKSGTVSRVSRDQTKSAIMKSIYGSTAVPKQVFGEGPLLDIFFEAMADKAPYVWNMNQMFLEMWDAEETCHSWLLPDNYHVHVKVKAAVEDTFHYLEQPYVLKRFVNRGVDDGRSLGANTIHSTDGFVVREMNRRCSYNREAVDAVMYAVVHHGRDEAAEHSGFADDSTKLLLTLWKHYKDSGFLSARILDCITDFNARYVDRQDIFDLIDSLPAKPFELLCIHDCFRCLPSYGNDLRKQYNLQLALIAKSNMLEWMLSAILKQPISIAKPNPDMWKEILEANYSLS